MFYCQMNWIHPLHFPSIFRGSKLMYLVRIEYVNEEHKRANNYYINKDFIEIEIEEEEGGRCAICRDIPPCKRFFGFLILCVARLAGIAS